MIYKMEQICTQEIIFTLLVKCNSFITAHGHYYVQYGDANISKVWR